MKTLNGKGLWFCQLYIGLWSIWIESYPFYRRGRAQNEGKMTIPAVESDIWCGPLPRWKYWEPTSPVRTKQIDGSTHTHTHNNNREYSFLTHPYSLLEFSSPVILSLYGFIIFLSDRFQWWVYCFFLCGSNIFDRHIISLFLINIIIHQFLLMSAKVWSFL